MLIVGQVKVTSSLLGSGSTLALGSVRALPLAVLGLSGTPLTRGSGSTASSSGSTPLIGGTVPVAALGSSEARGGSLPVTTGLGEASGDGGRADLIGRGELLLLNLLLGLSLGVAV